MKSTPDWASYADRLARVITYIYDHLDEELDLNRLAEVACLSPYHWHRVYRGLQGETIAQTVKRLRLQRAAHDLIHSPDGVEKVARKSGYPNREAFSRAFHKAYGLSPGAYRDRGTHTEYQPSHPKWSEKMYEVEIRHFDGATLATIPHKGPYMEIGKAFEILGGNCGPRGLFTPATKMIGIYYDDPDSKPAEELNSRACITVPEGTELAAPLEEVAIPACDCAVLTHKGPYSELKTAWDFLYGSWLENSGKVPGDFPGFELYLNSPQDTAPQDLVTEIHMPLRG